MAQQHCLFVFGSISLTLATIACGIALLAPYWLINVQNPIPIKASVEKDYSSNNSYLVPTPTNATCVHKYRGLWAQCSDVCQWFWESNFKLEKDKFIQLGWHLATQVLYLLGVLMVVFCELVARFQLCCRARMSVYRLLGFTLLVSFIFQAAGIAVFGGFANRDYGASIHVSDHTYLGWCFWMTLVGGSLSLLSGIFFLFLDCCSYIDDEEFLK